MFCVNCGHHMEENAVACPACGTAVKPAAQQVPPAQGSVDNTAAPQPSTVVYTTPQPAPYIKTGLGFAITLLVLGIVLTCCTGVPGIICSIIAVIYAGMAKSAINNGDYVKAQSNARVAKGLNIAALILLIIMVIYLVASFALAWYGIVDSGMWQEFIEEFEYQYDQYYNSGALMMYQAQGLISSLF